MAPLLQRQKSFRGKNAVYFAFIKNAYSLCGIKAEYLLKWVVMYSNHWSWKGYVDYLLNVQYVSSLNSYLLGFDISNMADTQQGSRQNCSLRLLPWKLRQQLTHWMF